MIIHGDCLIEMENIPDKSIDMILCDLPYGITSCKWDAIISFDELWKSYNRICKDNAAIILFANEPFASKLRLSNLKIYKYDLYWQKEKIVNILQVKKRFGKTIENICIFYKKQCTYKPKKYVTNNKVRNKTIKSFGNLVCNSSKMKIKQYIDDGTRYPKDLLKFNRDYNFLHPTQKPVALLEYLIETFSNRNDVILDNCAGSGSSAIACINTDRQYIMIEKNEKFYNIMKKRIGEHEKQFKLF